MANRLYNKQVSPKGYKLGGKVKGEAKVKAIYESVRDKNQPMKLQRMKDKFRAKKMGGGMMKRPMMKEGGKIPSVESTPKNMPHLKRARKKYKAIVQDQNRVKKKMGGSLKPVQPNQKGLKKLPTEVRNKMGYMKKGGKVKK
tara:strand:+ start:318 stop:743 length:426 start_codon:yes stop_codon:yes gene_type:complete